jgi:K+-sensing histidine kinase KdpD
LATKATVDVHLEIENATLQIEPNLIGTVCINLLENSRKAIHHDLEREYFINVHHNGKSVEEKS